MTPMPDRPAHILYVDDDVGLARLVDRAARRLGLTLPHVATAEEGLAAIAARAFDVVALDHHLPTGTGLDFLDALRGREQAPPVVYVTGSEDLSVAISALKAGAVGYVTKTVAHDFIELLFHAVDPAMGRGRPGGEREKGARRG